MAFYIWKPEDDTPPHVDRELNCPFCGHNFIEVLDDNDGYGRHIVHFECDTELVEGSPKGFLGCGRSIELYEDTVEECKADYRRLNELLPQEKNASTDCVDGGD